MRAKFIVTMAIHIAVHLFVRQIHSTPNLHRQHVEINFQRIFFFFYIKLLSILVLFQVRSNWIFSIIQLSFSALVFGLHIINHFSRKNLVVFFIKYSPEKRSSKNTSIFCTRHTCNVRRNIYAYPFITITKT